MVAQALGLLAAASATALFMHQTHLVASVLQRQFRDEDHQAVVHLLRSELRVAGQRQTAGRDPDHDELRLDGPADNPSLQYLCDRCGATNRAQSAGFKIQSLALTHRHPGAAAYQALHDGRLSGLKGWSVQAVSGSDCGGHLHIRLAPSSNGTTTPWLQVRPRNLGLQACESRGGSTTPTDSSTASPRFPGNP